MERTNTKDIVSKVAYLIGVKKTVLYNQFETERPGYLKELDENQNARTIRSLCKLRMTLLHRFKKIDDMLRFELKNLKTIEFFDKDDIKLEGVKTEDGEFKNFICSDILFESIRGDKNGLFYGRSKDE